MEENYINISGGDGMVGEAPQDMMEGMQKEEEGLMQDLLMDKGLSTSFTPPILFI